MEKMFHVFISSTYSDLIEERKKVSEAVAKAGHVPEGMEIFPASSQSQMSFIEKVINRCDYYILILASRYGSTGTDGISYTEKEYKYALSKNIPILVFIRSSTDGLKELDIDQDQTKIAKFKKNFTADSLVDFWSTSDELATKALAALSQALQSHQGVGWIRGNHAATNDVLNDLNNLRKENDRLQSIVNANIPLINLDDIELAGLDDLFTVNYSYYFRQKNIQDSITTSWQNILKIIGPEFRDWASKSLVSKSFEDYLKSNDMATGYPFLVQAQDIKTILIQFEALNFLEMKTSPVELKYKLKPQGLQTMLRLNVVQK